MKEQRSVDLIILIEKIDACRSFALLLPMGNAYMYGDVKDTKKAVQNQLSTSTHRLSNSLGSSKDTTHRHLKSLGKSYKNYQRVPYELKKTQAKRRAEVCKQLHALPKSDRFVECIIMRDEK
ncbi:hypothetical protein EVAR_95589_1 [Eumeta japonica]|uniref:Mariner Mos1 transposase n=1 Tax=Eumeta variegata TaxID=151549 RepID=A0A4C1VKA5_EUMVA|nr:hypothetical protein EVAR_95589_1 [Eumeta japonica]